MKGKGKSMKSGNKSKVYGDHSAEKRRSQDPGTVMSNAFNRASKGGE